MSVSAIAYNMLYLSDYGISIVEPVLSPVMEMSDHSLHSLHHLDGDFFFRVTHRVILVNPLERKSCFLLVNKISFQ